MTSSCTDIESLIDKRVRGLDEAERLVLEQHLNGCGSCRETAGFMRAISRMIDTAPNELGDAARKRAISGAFSNIVREKEEVRRTRFVGPAAFAVAAAAAIALFVQDAAQQAKSPVEPRNVVAHATQAPAAKPVASSAPSKQWIEASEPETLTFAHAQVTLDAGSRVRFDDVSTTLELAEGRATVDVDVSKGRAFRVTTQRFRVEVLGTRFIVSPQSVEVEHGRVQVFDLEGKTLARDLRPGVVFSLSAKRAVQPSEPRINARVWLSRAREALSQGDSRTARELVLRSEESDPSRQDRAEAGTLRAEHRVPRLIRYSFSIS